jgi:hypothetical protein
MTLGRLDSAMTSLQALRWLVLHVCRHRASAIATRAIASSRLDLPTGPPHPDASRVARPDDPDKTVELALHVLRAAAAPASFMILGQRGLTRQRIAGLGAMRRDIGVRALCDRSEHAASVRQARSIVIAEKPYTEAENHHRGVGRLTSVRRAHDQLVEKQPRSPPIPGQATRARARVHRGPFR